jgi:hypothetical protein
MYCISIGRTEFPGPGTYMYFGYQVTVLEKYKLGPKYSQRYNGYFITPGGEKVEFSGKRGTDLLQMMDKDIKILNLKALYKSGELTESNLFEFLPQ